MIDPIRNTANASIHTSKTRTSASLSKRHNTHLDRCSVVKLKDRSTRITLTRILSSTRHSGTQVDLTLDVVPVLTHTGGVRYSLHLDLLEDVGSGPSLRCCTKTNHGDIFVIRRVVDGSVECDGLLCDRLVEFQDDKVVGGRGSVVVVVGVCSLGNDGTLGCIIEIVEIVWSDDNFACCS